MDKVNVNDLAQEFSVKSSLVMSELKKIGVMVISPDTPVDHGIADRVRKRLQFLADQAVEEAQKAERAKEKAARAKAAKQEPVVVKPRARKSIKELGKKAGEAEPAAEPVKAAPPVKAPAEVVEAKEVEARKPQVAKPAAKPAAPPAVKKKTAAAVVKPSPAEPAPSATLKPRKGKKHFTKDDELTDVAAAAPEVETAEPVTESVSEPVAEVPAPAPAPVSVSKPLPSAPADAPRASTPPPLTPLTPRIGPEGRRNISILKPAMPLKRPEPVRMDTTRRPGQPSRPPSRPTFQPRKGRRPEAPPVPRVPLSRPERPVFTEFKPVVLSEAVTVKELSEKLDVKTKDLLRELLTKGIPVSINQTLDEKTARDICELFGYRASFVSFEEEVVGRQAEMDRPEDRFLRAPVVTVMGHVDHGKTSLLDAIREAKVAEKEAGGITQHMGAYHVDINNRRIVFLDTPGHAAFTLMRARGAKVTDIVVLVVAADDGVMPQTEEAINHARAAQVPIIVAINKIDKPEANVDRVKKDLAEHNLLAEDWGGETVVVPVSALQKTNLELLLEMILLVADLRELRANPKLAGSGAVLEAKLDRGRGSVATVLVQNGTVRVGDSFIAGPIYGRVRAMLDDLGRPIDSAGPSTAVEILGLQGIPSAGDPFQVLDDTGKAKQIGSVRQARQRERDLQKTSRLTLEHLHDRMKSGDVKELAIVLKGDVHGSVEVLADSLQKLSTDKVKVRIVHAGVGAITETDVLLASAVNAIIVGFNVRPQRGISELAETEGVDLRLHTIIYNVADEIRAAMLGLLEHTFREKYMGRAEVREVYRIAKIGTVAGGYVQDGVITRNAEVRLLRDSVVIYEGKMKSLRRFKDDVSEVKAGYECGFSLENYNDLKTGDIVEAFVQEKVMPKLM